MSQFNQKKKGCGCIPLIGALCLTVGGGYFLYRNFIGEELTPSKGAKIIPDETIVTSFVSTNVNDWSKLSEFGSAQTQQYISENLQEVEENIFENNPDISYQKDIQPWLGGIMFAVLPSDEAYTDYDLAAVVGIKNKFKAWSFLKKLEKDSDVLVKETKYKDITIYDYQDDGIFVAQFKNYLVMGDNSSTIEKIIDTFKGENSLADKKNFKKTIAHKLNVKNPVVKIFLPDYEGVLSKVIDSSSYGENNPFAKGKSSSDVNSIVMAMGIEDNGIHFQATADVPSYLSDNRLNKLKPVSDRLIKNLPENTLLMINSMGISESWEEIDKEKDAIPELNQLIEYWERTVQRWYNIDLYNDIFSWMNGEFALAVYALDNPTLPDQALGGLGLFETYNRPQAENSITKMENLARRSFPSLTKTQEDIKGVSVTNVTAFNSHLFSYGWNKRDSLMMSFKTDFYEPDLIKNRTSLLDSENFKLTTSSMPKSNLGYFYFDMEKTYSLFEELNGNSNLNIPWEAELVTDSLKAIAITSSLPEKETAQINMFLSLKKLNN